MRTIWASAAVVAAVAWTAGTARAGLEVGTVAPEFEGKEFVNVSETSLKRLRGHVVLYEIFRTW
jgi:hypothetical protein